MNNSPITTIPNFPPRTLWEPPWIIFNRVSQGIDVCRQWSRWGCIYTRHVMVRSELEVPCVYDIISEKLEEEEGRENRRTSRWPLRPVLLVVWHKSGGPSSLNVAIHINQTSLNPISIDHQRITTIGFISFNEITADKESETIGKKQGSENRHRKRVERGWNERT